MNYVVIKFGGSVIEQIHPSFYKNIAAMAEEKNLHPIIVHGGGPSISGMLEKLNIKTSFINGLRVTDAQVLDIVEMILPVQ